MRIIHAELCAVVLSLLSSTNVPAQPVRAASDPSTPIARLRIGGPAIWRQVFLPTTVGGVLSAQEAAPYTDLWISAARGALGPFGEDSVWQLARDYGGWLEVDVHAAGEPNQLAVLAVARVLPDGKTDLGELGRNLSACLEQLGGHATELRLQGHDYRIWHHETEAIVAPFERNGDLVFAAGHDLVHALPRVMAVHDEMAARTGAERGAPLVATVDLRQTLALTLESDGSDEFDAFLAELCGLASLGDLQLALRTAGPRVELELGIGFASGQRGLFRGLFPDIQGTPTLQRLAPPDCTSWKAGRLRLDLMVEAVIDAWAAAFGTKDRTEAREAIEEGLTFDPIDDFFGHLGDEVLVLGSGWQSGNDVDFNSVLAGTCLVFEVRDAKKLRAGLDAVRDAISHRRTDWQETEHAGETITSSSNALADEVHLCVTDKLLFMAFDAAGRELLETALDNRSAPSSDELPVAIERVVAHAPPGLNGFAVANLDRIATGYLGMTFDALRTMAPAELGLAPEPRVLEEAFAPFLGELAKNELDKVVTMTGFADGRWTYRVFW